MRDKTKLLQYKSPLHYTYCVYFKFKGIELIFLDGTEVKQYGIEGSSTLYVYTKNLKEGSCGATWAQQW